MARIADVAGLVERARSDGLAVSLTTTGDVAGVAPSIGTAAYRVVQEGLTNTRRHAGPGATATVEVAAGERSSLRVAIVDDGGTSTHPRPGTGAGFGLIGMRERVESSGGTLEVGPAPGPWVPGRSRRGNLDETMTIRVVLADDQMLVRTGFRALLDSEDDIEVVGEAGDGAEAVALATELAPRRRADGHPDAERRRADRGARDRRARRPR